MQVSDNMLTSVDEIMDAKFGKAGTPEREQFRREAYTYYMGQILQDARKIEKITQKELAMRVGVDKSHISKIEKGSKLRTFHPFVCRNAGLLRSILLLRRRFLRYA